MKVTVNYFGQLRQLAGRDAESRDRDAGLTLGDLLADAAREHGEEFKSILMDDAGELRPFLLILVNGTAVSKSASLTLQDGDEVTLLTPLSGG